MAKSFSQVLGVDYDEIFSSVAMLKSVGIMLALAAFMKSGKMDVKTSFLTSFRKENEYGWILKGRQTMMVRITIKKA